MPEPTQHRHARRRNLSGISKHYRITIDPVLASLHGMKEKELHGMKEKELNGMTENKAPQDDGHLTT